MRRINVIWVGIEKGLKQVEDIYDQLDRRLIKLGFKSDGKKFSPHITISRVKTGRNKEALAHSLMELQDRDFGVFKINTLKLMKSVLTPKGPIYSTLHEVKK
jgi:2'-5' RNA ligase